MAEIKQTTLDIAEKLRSEFQVNGSELTLKEPEKAYASTLPETVTHEQAKIIHKHDRSYVEGFTYAAGEEAVAVLKANKDLTHVNASTSVGAANIDVTVKRVGSVLIPAKEKGGESTTKEVVGYTQVKQTSSGGAEIKRIKSHIHDLATKELG